MRVILLLVGQLAICLSFFPGAALGQTAPPILNVQNANTAPLSGDPIEVEDCHIQELGGMLLARTGLLEIEFTNESRVTADLVRFRIKWGEHGVAYIRDQGKFSPGITIKHKFRQGEGRVVSPIFSHPDLRCSVQSAHFVDGTTWTRPVSSVGQPSARPTTSSAVPRGYVGAVFEQLTAATVSVRLVIPGSPAFTAGLEQGDVIDAIDGERISLVSDATTLISGSQSGSVLKFQIARAGQEELVLDIAVAPRP